MSWLMKMKAEIEPLLQVEQQVEDLGAQADVERRGRLVGDDDARVGRDGPGDADALALAAGEGVRVALHRRGRQADEVEQLGDALAQLRAREGCR